MLVTTAQLLLALAIAEGTTAAESTDEATALVEQLGGKVRRDDSRPDRPVVAVDLALKPLTDEGLARLTALKDLRELNIRGTKITDSGVAHLAGLDKLEYVNVESTAITDRAVEVFAHLPRLRWLFLNRTRITNSALRSLAGNRTLERLYVSINSITDDGMVHVAGLTQLKMLHMGRTQVTDAGLAHLRGLTQLERLTLEENRITDAGLDHLRPLVNLTMLYMHDVSITDAGLARLKPLVKLQRLRIRGAKVSDSAIEDLKRAIPGLRVERADVPAVSFEQADGLLRIAIDGKPVAEYVYNDEVIRRPYFRHLRTPSGIQVTRNHPPVKGRDRDDHPTMHPGLWLAFGDLGGADFWRNKGRVRHAEFVEPPRGGRGRGSFAVRNAYEADGRVLCTEVCRITVSLQPTGYVLSWDSTFRSEQAELMFGDQEEMGLGVRVATPLAVVNGRAEIADSDGRKNEREVWGKQADWCAYAGEIDGRNIGVVLMPSLRNFRRSWFHARDYGLLVANPFGRQAFTKGEKSRHIVRQGDEFRLGFGVFVYDVPSGDSADIPGAFRRYADNERR
jgi:hypothetical protein